MEQKYLTLHCKDCDHPTCRLNQIVFYDSDGCVQQVSEEIYLRYQHLMTEVFPFIKSTDKGYLNFLDDLYNTLDKLYQIPITKKLGHFNLT